MSSTTDTSWKASSQSIRLLLLALPLIRRQSMTERWPAESRRNWEFARSVYRESSFVNFFSRPEVAEGDDEKHKSGAVCKW